MSSNDLKAPLLDSLAPLVDGENPRWREKEKVESWTDRDEQNERHLLHPPRAVPESLQSILQQHESAWQAFWNEVQAITQAHRSNVRLAMQRMESAFAYLIVTWMVVFAYCGTNTPFYHVVEIVDEGCLAIIMGPMILFLGFVVGLGIRQQQRRGTSQSLNDACKHATKNDFGRELSLSVVLVQDEWVIRVSRQDGQFTELFRLFSKQTKKHCNDVCDMSDDESDNDKDVDLASYYQEHEESDGVHVYRLRSYLMETSRSPPPLPLALQNSLTPVQWKDFWKGLTTQLQHRQPWVAKWTITWFVLLLLFLVLLVCLIADSVDDEISVPLFVAVILVVGLVACALVCIGLPLFCLVFPRLVWPLCDAKRVDEYCRQQQALRNFQPQIVFYDTDNLQKRLENKWQTIQAKGFRCLAYFWQEEYDCELRLSCSASPFLSSP